MLDICFVRPCIFITRTLHALSIRIWISPFFLYIIYFMLIVDSYCYIPIIYDVMFHKMSKLEWFTFGAKSRMCMWDYPSRFTFGSISSQYLTFTVTSGLCCRYSCYKPLEEIFLFKRININSSLGQPFSIFFQVIT